MTDLYFKYFIQIKSHQPSDFIEVMVPPGERRVKVFLRTVRIGVRTFFWGQSPRCTRIGSDCPILVGANAYIPA